MKPPRMTEAQLQSAVMELARVLGWRAVHFRPAIDRSGRWSTPTQGAIGFPDCVLVRGTRLVFAELKSTDGRVSPQQAAWLRDLYVAGVEAYVWRPSSWLDGTIEETLRSTVAPRATLPPTREIA